MPLANPVIVVPGITASSLRDTYPVSPETVWSALLNHSYRRVGLHPDDLRYELVEPARVMPEAVFRIPYEELILELRHNLSESEDRPVPVFPFPYDWRQPLERIEPQLEAFVQEVIDRTRLLRHYAADREWMARPRANLVGHSMGGLLITGYLQRLGKKAPVERIATLATPFRGSYEALIKVLTGTASLSPLEPNSREREAARLTPALYYLVPSFERAVTEISSGEIVDLFSADAWQRGVHETLAEFIRLQAVDPPRARRDLLEHARALLQGMLDGARAYVQRIASFEPRSAGLARSAWLAILGVDARTRVRLQLHRSRAGVRYELSGEDRINEWSDGDPLHTGGDPLHTGDGTVPLQGAIPPFLPRESLVCVRPSDLGYWEIGDRGLESVVGWHGTIPKCNLVHRLLVKHFKGQDAENDRSVWGTPLPGVGVDSWKPPIEGLRVKG